MTLLRKHSHQALNMDELELLRIQESPGGKGKIHTGSKAVVVATLCRGKTINRVSSFRISF